MTEKGGSNRAPKGTTRAHLVQVSSFLLNRAEVPTPSFLPSLKVLLRHRNKYPNTKVTDKGKEEVAPLSPPTLAPSNGILTVFPFNSMMVFQQEIHLTFYRV